jgi:hypothetical protein
MDAPAMTTFHATVHELQTMQAGAWLMVGTLIGAFHFLTLRWNVGMLVAGRAWPFSLAIQLARFALLAGLLALVTIHLGASTLILVTVGIVATRAAILRREVAS